MHLARCMGITLNSVVTCGDFVSSVFTWIGAPAERVPSLESIYRVSLTVDLCEVNKIISFKNLFHHSQLGAPQREKTGAPGHVPSVPIG